MFMFTCLSLLGVLEELIPQADNDLDAGAVEGGEDLMVGVVDSDVLDLRCLEECHHAPWGR